MTLPIDGLVPRVGEALGVAEAFVDRPESDDGHLVILGVDEVVRADHAELARHGAVVHGPGLHQFVEARVRVAHEAHTEELVLGREGIFGCAASFVAHVGAHRTPPLSTWPERASVASPLRVITWPLTIVA